MSQEPARSLASRVDEKVLFRFANLLLSFAFSEFGLFAVCSEFFPVKSGAHAADFRLIIHVDAL